MSTPKYPRDLPTEWRKVKEDIKQNFSSANSRKSVLLIQTDTESGSISPSSPTPVSMSGPNLDVTITNGQALIIIGASFTCDIGEGVACIVHGSGPGGATFNSESMKFSNGITGAGLGGSISIDCSKVIHAFGLDPGSWNFEVYYFKLSGTGDPAVSERVITVLPF